MSINVLRRSADPGIAFHWYDFICPFCYVGQNRTKVLRQTGIEVRELPFEIHREIPPRGVSVDQRNGEVYERIEIEAKAANLELRWPAHLPNSRQALSAAAWILIRAPSLSKVFNEDLFAAHFARGEDIGERSVIDGYALKLGIDVSELDIALADGSAKEMLVASESSARQAGVRGTPTWLIGNRLISGLVPKTEFRLNASDAVRNTRASVD